jgi:hypothetical protein
MHIELSGQVLVKTYYLATHIQSRAERYLQQSEVSLNGLSTEIFAALLISIFDLYTLGRVRGAGRPRTRNSALAWCSVDQLSLYLPTQLLLFTVLHCRPVLLTLSDRNMSLPYPMLKEVFLAALCG